MSNHLKDGVQNCSQSGTGYKKLFLVLCLIVLCTILTSKDYYKVRSSEKNIWLGSGHHRNITKDSEDVTERSRYGWIPDWYNQTDIELLLRQRRQQVISVCEKRRDEIRRVMEVAYECEESYNICMDGRIGISIPHHLGVCYTHKAASTFWRDLLRKMVNISSEELTHNYTYIWTTVESYFSHLGNLQPNPGHPWRTIIIIRNPWHRLVSVYIQKQLIAGYERRKFQFICRDQVKPKNQQMLTFEEFFKCAVLQMEEGNYNRHWEPIFRRCAICDNPYTDFISMENMKTESKYVLHKAGLKNPESVMSQVRRETIRTVEEKKLSQNYMTYYETIQDQSLIERFAIFYQVDFDMFGYPTSPFTAITNN